MIKRVKIPKLDKHLDYLVPLKDKIQGREKGWGVLENDESVMNFPERILILPKVLLHEDKFIKLGLVKLYFVPEYLFGKLLDIFPKTLDAFVFSDMVKGDGWVNIKNIHDTKDVYVYVLGVD